MRSLKSIAAIIIAKLIFLSYGYLPFPRLLVKRTVSLVSPTSISNEEFVQYTRSRNRNLTFILDEIDFRVNSLPFSSLSECLLNVASEVKEKDERIHSLIDEVLLSLIRATDVTGNQPSYGIPFNSVINLLNSLVRSSYRWNRLSSPAKEVLQKHALIILTSSDSHATHLAIIKAFVSLQVPFNVLNADLQNVFLVYFEKLEFPTDFNRYTTEFLLSLSYLPLSWKQISSLSRQNIVTSGMNSMDEMGDKQMLTFLKALTRLGCPYSDLVGEDSRLKFLSNVRRILPFCDELTISSIIW